MVYFKKHGYEVKDPKPTGGKAGKGLNKTSTIQVFIPKLGRLVKQIRYKVGTKGAKDKAIQKGILYVNNSVSGTPTTPEYVKRLTDFYSLIKP